MTTTKKMDKFKDFVKSHATPSGFLKLGLVILMLLFIICPLIAILTNIRIEDFSSVFGNSKIGFSILFSVLYSVCGAAIAVIIATLASFLLTRSSIKGKKAISTLLTLSMLIPTISIGLGIRNIFGFANCGFGTLVIGSVITGFPIAFLLIYDSLSYENRAVYDAAGTLGIHKRVSFWKITLPYLKKPIINAFIATAVWIITDYGLPIEVAGNLPTLPTYLYEQAIIQFQYGKASIIGIFLLLPAIGSFIFNQFSKDSAQEESSKQIIQPTKSFNIVSAIILALIIVFISLPQIMFLIIAFTKNFPVDVSFTLSHFKDAFSPNSATNVWNRIFNSVLLAFFTGVFGSFFAYFGAYFSVRTKGILSKLIDLFAIISISIPGLVLGLGFVSLFHNTSGWFYGTMAIMVVANCAHFFGSPYLLAKNALSKLNKDYEIVGETLNISKFRIFWEVLLPNSFSTAIKMFSYFFVNSMITISAISFLVEYFNTPLSVEITRYQTSDDYAMQAVISIIILAINIVAKIGLEALADSVERKTNAYRDNEEPLSHNQFRVLTAIKNSNVPINAKDISKITKLPLGTVRALIRDFEMDDAIIDNGQNEYFISNHGSILIEPYRVRKAIVIAAGFGSRMMPVTSDTPKPLVKVNGTKIIETLLDALYAQDIKNIYIVRGYLGEQFNELLKKYPTVQFIDNPLYNKANNISSVYIAKNLIDRCYICEADLIISNPEIIKKYQYRTNYLGFNVKSTDDWCFSMKGRYIESVAIGGENVVQMVGISYWNHKDSMQLRTDINKVFNSHGGKENYWDNVPLIIKKKNYKVAVRYCKKYDVKEIDNFSELVEIDKSYKDYGLAKK